MNAVILTLFVLGYVMITLEHSLKVNKAAFALLTGVVCWAVYLVWSPDPEGPTHALHEQVSEIASILFFLMGAMTIVELIDMHGGFELITTRIRTRRKVAILWIVSGLSFFLSAILDNLTTAIVMTSVVGRLLTDRNDRLWMVGMVVIASNAGGAWSPLGDVTTTMLWVAHKVSADAVMLNLILPSFACLLVPLVVLSFWMRGNLPPQAGAEEPAGENPSGSVWVLFLGFGCLLLVPLFKVVLHLPPFMGMMLSLALMWILTEGVNGRRQLQARKRFSPVDALERIDTPSLLFFMGILLAVGALHVTGQLSELATWLDQTVPDRNVSVTLIGLLSSIIDNVPMVAGAIEMYSEAQFPDLGMNAPFWHFLAYCTGTGGSLLIIGSAAGVAVMGIEQVPFFWYLKRMSLLALLGYLAGVGVFLAQQSAGLLMK